MQLPEHFLPYSDNVPFSENTVFLHWQVEIVYLSYIKWYFETYVLCGKAVLSWMMYLLFHKLTPFFVVRKFKVYLFSSFQVCNILLSVVIVLKIALLNLFFFYNWYFVSCDNILISSLSPSMTTTITLFAPINWFFYSMNKCDHAVCLFVAYFT